MRHTVTERRKKWFFIRSLVRAFWDHLNKRQGRRAKSTPRPLFAEALEPRVLFSATPAPVEPDQQDVPVEEAPVAQEAVQQGSAREGQVAEPTGLSQEQLDGIVQAARQRWIDSGISAQQLAALDSVTYTISDLGGNKLGKANGFTITIDDDAGGSDSWFVDLTPGEDEEFLPTRPTQLTAMPVGEAAGKFDLLSTVLHEQGHILGLDDVPGNGADLMNGIMGEGTRRLPGAHQAAEAIPGSVSGDAFLAAAITRASTDASGNESNHYSQYPSISADGRYVAFQSYAGNLVPGDTNGWGDIFVKDLNTGAITLVSNDGSGNQANFESYDPSISADGRYVAFRSTASNLVGGDTNGQSDIFVKDLTTGVVTVVSTDSFGNQANGASWSPSISADGRFITFESSARNLVVGDTNDSSDVFVKDLTTGAITRVSTDGSGNQANGGSDDPSISADGNFVAFRSGASNLVAGDTNGTADIFVKNLTTGAITRVSTDASGNQSNDISYTPSISADGKFVAFESYASNLVVGDTNGQDDVFVKDLTTGAVTRVSTDASGTQGTSYSSAPSISADGKFVAFYSNSSNLVAGDTNGQIDIFVKDLTTGAITRVSTDGSGNQANSSSLSPSISADGKFVAFSSAASNLVAGDTNNNSDIFVKDISSLVPTATTTTEIDGSGNLVIDDSNGGNTNDNLTIVRDGNDYRITDVTNGIDVRIPIADVTGDIIINGNGGDDTFTIDLIGGSITRNIVFNGGANGATGDKLVVTGGNFGTVTYNATDATNGVLNFGDFTVTFTGLEPIDLTGSVIEDFTVNVDPSNAVAGGHTTTLSGSGTDTLVAVSGGFESVLLRSITGTLTINGESGQGDTINVSGVGSSFAAGLTINGGTGDDTVNFTGDVTFAAGKSLDVDLQNDDVSPGTDTVNFGANANVILSGAGTATVKASGDISFAGGSSLVSEDGDISIAAGDDVSVSGYIFSENGDIAIAADSDGNGAGNYTQTSVAVPVVPSGTVLHWAMDESPATNGIVIADDSGFGNNGSLSNDVGDASKPGQFGGGLDFGGNNTTDYVYLNPVSNWPTTELTISLWVQTTQAPSNTFFFSYAVPGQDNEILIGQDAFYIKGTTINANLDINDGNFHHVVFTWQSSDGAVTAYVDGVQKYTATAQAGASITGGGSLILGQDQDAVGGTLDANQAFAGVLDELSVINRALTAAEIAAFHSGVVGSASGNVEISANDIDLQGDIEASNGTVTLTTSASTRNINLGTAAAGTFALTNAELDRITAGTVQVGDSNSGAITVSAAITHGNHLSLTTGTSVTFNNAVTMAVNKNLTVSALGTTNGGITLNDPSADLVATGTGTISLTTARDIAVASGASVTTVNGSLSLSANQQATATSGSFLGVSVGGLVQSTGTGTVSVLGRGGDHAFGLQVGIYVFDGGDIIGGTSGSLTVAGTGGDSTGDGNFGVYLVFGSTITSGGGAVSVTGIGGGIGSSSVNRGVFISDAASITAGGSGTVVVTGIGAASSGFGNTGVVVRGTGSTITSGGGAVSVNGIEGGGTNRTAIEINNGSVTTAANGGTLLLTGDSMNFTNSAVISAPSNSTVTLRQRTNGTQIGLGAADSAGVLGLTDTELDLVSAGTVQIGDSNSGAITISQPITRAAATNLSLTTGTNQNIFFSGAGSLSSANGNVTLTTSGTGAILSGTATTDIAAGTGTLSLNAGSGGIGATGNAITFSGSGIATATTGNGNQYLRGSATIAAAGLDAGSGSINLESGTLTLGGSDRIADASTVVISGGAILALGSNSDTIGQLVLVNGTVSGTGTLTGNSVFDVREGTISAKIGGGVGLTKTGGNTVVLSGANTYTGDTLVSAGNLHLGNNSAITAGTVTLAGTNATLTVGNGFNGSRPLVISDIGDQKVLDLAGGSYSGSITIEETTKGNFFIGRPSGIDVYLFGKITGTGQAGIRMNGLGNVDRGYNFMNGTTDYTGPIMIDRGAVRVHVNNALGTGTIEIGGPSSGAALELGTGVDITNDIIVNPGTGRISLINGSTNATVSGDILANYALGFGYINYFDAGETITVTGTISGTGSVGTSGGGTVILSGDNSYTGGTTVGGAVLRASHNNALGTNTVTLNATDANLELSNGITLPNNLVISSVGDSKWLRLQSGATAAEFAGNITIQETVLHGLAIQGRAGATLTLSGTISGATGTSNLFIGSPTGGTVVLSGNNTYRGGTWINEGTVRAESDNALSNFGSVSMHNSGTVLELADGVTIARSLTVSNTGNQKTLRIQAGATSATYSGLITISETTANNFDVSAGAGQQLTLSGGISGGGTAGVEKVGAGTVIIEGSINHVGATTITEGILDVDGTATGGDTYTVASGATLRGSGSISANISAAANSTIVSDGNLTLGNAASASGFVSNANLTIGAGNTVTINDADAAVLGPITVVNGTLTKGGGSQGFAFSSGDALSGSGTINGAVTTTGATIAAGSSPAILELAGDLNIGDNSTFDVEIGGDASGEYDQLVVTGSVTIGTGVTLNLQSFGGFVPTGGEEFILIDNDSNDPISGAFSGLSEGTVLADFFGSGLDAVITYTGGDGNDLALVVIGQTGEVSSGDAVITDIAGLNNNLTLSAADGGANFQIQDSLQRIKAGTGATQVDPFTIKIPTASVTGDIIINGSDGDDTLTIDLSGGPITRNIIFNGGANGAGGDKLVVTNGTFGTVTYDATDATNGVLDFGTFTVTFTGLEPVDLTGLVIDDFTVNVDPSNAVAGGQTTTISQSGGTDTLVTIGGGFESVLFRSLTGTLTINGEDGESDTIDVSGFGTSFAGGLVINGGTGTDTVNWNTTAALASLNITAEAINLTSGVVNTGTGSQTYNGAVTLDADTTLTAADVTFNGTVDGGAGSGFTGPEGVYQNVAEAADFQLVYALAIGTNDNLHSSVPYSVNIAGSIADGSFDRVAYYLELDNGTGLRYVYVSADAFTTKASELGVPSFAGSNKSFQQLLTNMNVASNAAGIVTGTGLTTGNIEFWPYNYAQGNTAGVPNANGGTYDFGDQNAGGSSYGSMQIHNYDLDGAGPGTTGQTLFALNNFGSTHDLGIGNNPGGSPDWTFAGNAGSYSVKNLYILVNSGSPGSDLTINTSGNVDFNGVVGGTGALGDVTITSTGSTVTVDAAVNASSFTSTGSDSIDVNATIDAGSGNVTLSADDVAINGSGSVVTTGTTSVLQKTAGRQINLGTETAGQLSLTDAELDRINAGTIQIGNASSGAVNVSAALSHTNANAITLTAGAGQNINLNAGMTTAGGVVTLSSPTVLGASVSLDTTNAGGFAAGAAISFGSTINLGANTLTHNAGAATTSITTVISGTGGLTKAGTGTLTLSGSNTYSGITTVNAGTLALSGGNAINKNGAVSLANTSGAILSLLSSETIGSLSGGGATGGNVSLGANTLTVGGAATTTYSGAISGAGSLIKSGTGTLTLAGTNTYSGTTTVSQGILDVDGTHTGGSTVSIASGATLRGSGSITADINGAAGSFIAADGATFALGNSASLTGFATDGTLTVAAGQTVTIRDSNAAVLGSSVVVNGVLTKVGGSQGFSLSSGDVLSGTGTINGAVVTNTGTIAPGNSPGILSTGNLNLDGGTYYVEIGGTTPGNLATNHDQIAVTGTVTLGAGTATLNPSLINGFLPTNGNQFVIISNDGVDAVSGTFSGLSQGSIVQSNVNGTTDLVISYVGGDGNDVALVAGNLTTRVFVDGSGNLVIEDINDATNDQLTIQVVGSNLVISDADGGILIDAQGLIDGTTGDGSNSVTVALSSFTGNVIVRAGDGNDTIAFQNMDLTGTQGITVEDGAGTDTVTFSGAASTLANGTINVVAQTITVNSAVDAGTVGNITLNANGGSVLVNANLSTGGAGAIDLDATGTITQADGSTISSGSGTISLDATGNITLASVSTTGLVAATSGAAILDGGDSAVDVTAGSFSAVAASGIGAANYLETSLGNLEASSGTGNLRIQNTGALTIGGVTGALSGLSASNRDIEVRSTGDLTIDEAIAAGGGDITLTTDGIAINAALSSSTGVLTIAPLTASTTIGIGGGAGTLNLDDAELANLTNGFVDIVIGSTTAGTGAVDIDSSLFQDRLTIAGGSISVTELNAGTGTVTLTARSGAITEGGNAGADINAGTLNLNAAGAIGASGAGNQIALNASTLHTNSTLGGSNGNQYFSDTSAITIGATLNAGTGTATLTQSGTFRLTDNAVADATTLVIEAGASLNINGSSDTLAAVIVNDGGTLFGEGTLTAAVTVNDGGIITPGTTTGASGPRIISTGALTLEEGGTYVVELDGTAGAGVNGGNDQLLAAGTVTINNATLQLITLPAGYNSTAGETFVIINNSGAGAVNGTFYGLAEGSYVSVPTALALPDEIFQISYVGGTGNDVVLIATGQTATTNVRIDGSGNLVIDDILGAATNDNLSISRSGGNFIIQDLSGNPLGTLIVGATQTALSRIVVPDTLVTGGIIINALAGNDTITLGELGTLGGALTVDGGTGTDTITQSANATVTLTGAGAASYTAEQITLLGGAGIATDSGAITLLGNSGGTAAGNFKGITAFGVDLNSVSGNITLTGQGGNTGTNNYGIYVGPDRVAGTSSITTGGAGTITISGTGRGAAASAGQIGVLLSGTAVEASGSGAVSISGRGGSSLKVADGLIIEKGSSIEVGTGDLSLTGTGGTGASGARGVVLSNSAVLSNGGSAISITGTAGNAVSSEGVQISDVDISTGGTGTLTVRGTGGGGAKGASPGVTVAAGSVLETVNGELLIQGTGTGALGSGNDGVLLTSGAQLRTTGSGNLTVAGTGGTASASAGISMNKATLSVAAGNMSLTGTGRAANYGRGIEIEKGSQLTSSGVGNITITGSGSASATIANNSGVNGKDATIALSGSGALTITGTAGNGTTLNEGVSFSGMTVSTASGSIDIFGTGRGNRGEGSGVVFDRSTTVTAGTTGNLTVRGTGSAFGLTTTRNNRGVEVSGMATLSVTDGNLSITGTGGGNGRGTGNHAIDLVSGTVRATGGGDVTLSGTAGFGGTGIRASKATVRTTTGSLSMTGFGGGGTRGNYGIYITLSSVQSTAGGGVDLLGRANAFTTTTSNMGVWIDRSTFGGLGTVSIIGTGGGGTGSNHGIYMNAITQVGAAFMTAGTKGAGGAKSLNQAGNFFP